MRRKEESGTGRRQREASRTGHLRIAAVSAVRKTRRLAARYTPFAYSAAPLLNHDRCWTPNAGDRFPRTRLLRLTSPRFSDGSSHFGHSVFRFGLHKDIIFFPARVSSYPPTVFARDRWTRCRARVGRGDTCARPSSERDREVGDAITKKKKKIAEISTLSNFAIPAAWTTGPAADLASVRYGAMTIVLDVTKIQQIMSFLVSLRQFMTPCEYFQKDLNESL